MRAVFSSKTLKTNSKNCKNIFEDPIKILQTQGFFRDGRTATVSAEFFWA